MQWEVCLSLQSVEKETNVALSAGHGYVNRLLIWLFKSHSEGQACSPNSSALPETSTNVAPEALCILYDGYSPESRPPRENGVRGQWYMIVAASHTRSGDAFCATCAIYSPSA
jgi:hypothetical protein